MAVKMLKQAVVEGAPETDAEAKARVKRERLAKSRKTIEEMAAEQGWIVEHETMLNGRYVEQNTELHIKGEYGRFRFVSYTLTDKGVEWVTVLSALGGFRSFRPERVRTVHRINKMRVNKEEEGA